MTASAATCTTILPGRERGGSGFSPPPSQPKTSATSSNAAPGSQRTAGARTCRRWCGKSPCPEGLAGSASAGEVILRGTQGAECAGFSAAVHPMTIAECSYPREPRQQTRGSATWSSWRPRRSSRAAPALGADARRPGRLGQINHCPTARTRRNRHARAATGRSVVRRHRQSERAGCRRSRQARAGARRRPISSTARYPRSWSREPS